MKFLVGLGNPGDRYTNNRHNIGFRVIDFLSKQFAFPPWKHSSSYHSSKGTINDEKIVLIKPTTFMNDSGTGVINASNFFKVDYQNIFVFHDDLNLNWGVIKKKLEGGHGGHNGLRSISNAIGKNYKRIQIGIGRPDPENPVSNYVLSGFTLYEEYEIPCLLEFCASNIISIIKENSFIINGIDLRTQSTSY